MKTQLSPVVSGVVIAVCVLFMGFWLWRSNSAPVADGSSEPPFLQLQKQRAQEKSTPAAP